MITFSGKEHIPKDGAVIFIANHPSTLMDPLVLGALLERPLYYLAAAEFMGKGLVFRFLEYFIHMIPVYRPDTRPGEASKNKDVFRKCYEHLDKEGVILIFPEGSSITANRLRPLKTGAARIALGAELNSNGNTKVTIVPIGINYGDSHSFRKDLYVNIGPSISTDDPRIANIEDEFDKTNALNELMTERLKEQLIHVEDEKLDAFFNKIGMVINHHFLPETSEKTDPKAKFQLDKQIQEGLHFYYKREPQVIDSLNEKMDIYLDRVKFHGVSDASLATLSPKIRGYDYLRILFGTPVFVLGFIFNFIPYYGAIWTYRQLKVDLSFRGSIGVSLGLAYYLIWYIGLGVIVANLFNLWWMGFVFFTVGYLSGRFTMHYLNLLGYLREKGRLRKLLKSDRSVLRSLIHQREEIIDEVERYALMTE